MLPPWSAIPFVLFLLCIAILPLSVPHFWESNRNKSLVGFVLSIPVILLLLKHEPISILHTLEEYFSFICLLGSLFTISGGIALTGDLRATPRVNTTFLAIGALLANFIGTTGASMVLIRAFLKTNSERHVTRHLLVFFIFIVSNCGGLLTPLGDPPLFLGYLRGVPFFWTLKLFPLWALMNFILLTVFYLWDSKSYAKESQKDIKRDITQIVPLKMEGKLNLLFLLGVLVSVFFPTPWREGLMILMTLLSIQFGSKKARHHNNFSWGPIVEVAILFAAIFITMVPALMLLKEHGTSIGILQPWQFFWTAGVLSSFLDNAPTYVTFLSLAQGLGLSADVVGVSTKVLMAISAGSVFMGANSYIGNGPNFMVKAIADHAGYKTPSFFGYMGYAFMILFPIYFLITFIFFV